MALSGSFNMLSIMPFSFADTEFEAGLLSVFALLPRPSAVLSRGGIFTGIFIWCGFVYVFCSGAVAGF